MSAIVKLKAGIQTADWSLVVGAYEDMTGDSSVTLPQGDLGPVEVRSIRSAVVTAIDEALRRWMESAPSDGSPPDEDKEEQAIVCSSSPPLPSPPPSPSTIHAAMQGFSIDPTPKDMEEAKVAQVAARPRVPRPPTQVATAECSDCGQQFTPAVKPGGDMGSLCPQCLSRRRPQRL